MTFSDETGAGNGACLFLLAALLIAAMAVGQLGATAMAAVKRGGDGPDLLVGTAHGDRIYGRAGSDTIYGKGGGDKLVGGTGGDLLRGGRGKDKLVGGPGDDTVYAKDGVIDRVECGSGEKDLAVADADDLVSVDCEQRVGQAVDGPPPPAASGPVPSVALPVPSASPEPTPPLDESEEEESEEEEKQPVVGFEEQPLAMFPAGHGWTGNGVGTFGDVGPPLVVNNDRSFRITTDGDGDESIATSPLLDPVDLIGSHVSVQGQIGFSTRLDTAKLRLSSGDIATDYAEATVWNADSDPIILRSSFEFQSLPVKGFHVVGDVDWSKIDRAQLIVTDNHTGPVDFYVAGIYAVPTSHQATVSFTFDDGYESVFKRGLRKLSAYRFPATVYVIADEVGDPGILSLDQLDTLRDQDHWEIAGHAMTVAAHNLPNGLDGLEPEALKAEMDGLRDWLDENGFSRASFAYPKGAAGSEVRSYVTRDYCAARATARGEETIPPRDNHTIRGWSVNGLETSVAEIDDAIDQAVSDGTWLVLTFHDLVDGTVGASTEFNNHDFGEVVDHVRALQKKEGLEVRTIGSVVGNC